MAGKLEETVAVITGAARSQNRKERGQARRECGPDRKECGQGRKEAGGA